MSKTKYSGAIQGLLDEYKKSINELITVIREVSDAELTTIIDQETQDVDCKSIRSILSHVVQSGYTYVIEIRKWLGEDIDYREKVSLDSVEHYELALLEMFQFNQKLFQDYPDIQLVEFDALKKISVRWGHIYDVEQLMEHAIVHVLRHRRQIENFKTKLK